ncbi:MAG: DNA polymerase III subunit delta [Gaiellaceae bacterium]
MAELKPAYLLTGSDRPKVVRALRRLRERVGEEATERLSALETSGADVVAASNALGLFAVERRLVVVEDVEGWKVGDVDAVTAYLDDPAPATVLALVGADVRADAPLTKAVARAGEVLVFELPKRGRKVDLAGWVAVQFASQEAQADPSACRALVGLVGENLDELAAEVDKLTAWASGEPITEHAVALLVAPRAETPPFALTDAWGRRDVGAVLAAGVQLVERTGEPARDALPRLVGLLLSHVRRVADCQAFAAEGVSPKEAAERIKKNRYYVEKLFEQAANFTADELRDAIVRLAQLDLAFKGGSRLPSELEFDRALVELTSPRAA